jgi:bifunctional DNase/RNase
MLLEMKVFGLAIDPLTNAPIVILKDNEEKYALPIWIGLLEASAIAMELEKIQFPRPMTHDLMKEMLNRMEVNVQKIEVGDLKDNVYYATIHIETKDSNCFKIDARPSDAIALALRTRSPIFVHTKVLEKSKKIDLRSEAGQGSLDSKKWSELLEKLSPEAFGKYKM